MFGCLEYSYGPFGVFFWVLLWVFVAIMIIRLIQGRHSFHSHRFDWMERKDSLDILNERYARGEIDKREFEEKKADIMKQS